MNSVFPASVAARASVLRRSPPLSGVSVGNVIAWSAGGLQGSVHLQLEQRASGLHGVLVFDVDAIPKHALLLSVESVRAVGFGTPAGGSDVAVLGRTGFQDGAGIIAEFPLHLTGPAAFLDICCVAPLRVGDRDPQRFTIAYQTGL